MIYLDYASSTNVSKEVLDTYNDATMEYYCNPNSSHLLGVRAKDKIDLSTKNIAKLLRVEEKEIIYTSGATESNNLVIKGIAKRYKNFGKHILLSSLEHQSLVAPAMTLTNEGFEVELIPLKKDGTIDIDSLKSMIRKDTILVSVTSIDSELGIKQPIEEIANIIKEYDNCRFHTDASQAIGKTDIDYSNVDLITIAPHKFYGLNGMGILIKKNKTELIPIIDGGRSTTVYRSGTPSVAEIASMEKALELAFENQKEYTNIVEKINLYLMNKLEKIDNVHINSTNKSIPYIINFSVDKTNSTELVDYMSNNNICISAKTSCCPINAPSKLVYALTKDKNLSTTSVRVSLSHLTTKEEIDIFIEKLKEFLRSN